MERDAELLATDNGNPSDMISFKSSERYAFSGKCLCIVKDNKQSAKISVKIQSEGLAYAKVNIKTQ